MNDTIKRNIWGAITNPPRTAREILCDAIIAGLIEEEYCNVDRKHRGSALNHDVYDFCDGVVLIQSRHTICDKYGNHPRKEYYIIFVHDGEIMKFEAPHKMAIVRAAKLGLPPGGVIKKICKTTDPSELFARFLAAPRMQGKEVAA